MPEPDAVTVDATATAMITPTGSPPTRRRSRLAVAAGVVSLVYVSAYCVDLVVLRTDAVGFNALQRGIGSLPGRLGLVGVWFALLFHGLDGVRVFVEDLRPALRRHDLGMRALVGFVTFAAGIPVALVIVWPAVRRWFA